MLLFGSTSCYDLDLAPDDQLSSNSFFKNETHAKEAMMAVYARMYQKQVFGVAFSHDGMGGISVGYDPQSYQDFQIGNWSSSNSWVSNKWSNIYEGIARANTLLQNVDKCEMSDQLKDQYRAEARFMRGLYYFELMNFFGGVPLYDESTNIGTDVYNMLSPRSSLDETRDFIDKDFQFAAQYLPATWPQTDNGRATSVAAKAFRAKLYLYAKKYQEAANLFKEVIDSGTAALYPNYADLFNEKADACSEMIFSVQCLGGTGNNLGIPSCFYLGTRSSFGSSWNNVSASISYVNSFEWKDGEPFDWNETFNGATTKQVYGSKIESGNATKVDEWSEYKDYCLEMYEDRDPRMAASVILPFTEYHGWMSNKDIYPIFIVGIKTGTSSTNVTISNNNQTFLALNGGNGAYPWRKFVPEGDMGGALTNREYTPINFPLMRYADVLLMYAECLNELGKPLEACEYINQVRARVGMPGLNSGSPYLVATTKDEVFARIRHERVVELGCEGHSYNDMRRWGVLEELNGRQEKKINNANFYKRKVQSRDYLWPIPAGEIDKNPLLEQNPGW